MDEISTIFIIGFPDDFRERELINMFLFASGFETAMLKSTTIQPLCHGEAAGGLGDEPGRKQLIGFVKFSSPVRALHARDVLNGRILDQESGLVLKAEIAKKNLFVRPGGSGRPVVIADPTAALSHALRNISLMRRGGESSDDESTEGCPIAVPRTDSALEAVSLAPLTRGRIMNISVPGQTDPAIITDPPSSDSLSAAAPVTPIPIPIPVSVSFAASGLSVSPSSGGSMSPSIGLLPLSPPNDASELSALQRSLISSASLGSMAAVVGENFPCNTLYVGNLPPSAAEDELRVLFRPCLGYRRLSFRPKSSGPMCFVEFDDIACATAAMETLYGTMLSCSSAAKGGIRLSFSKNPLGLRVASPAAVTGASSPLHSHGAHLHFTAPFPLDAFSGETENSDHRLAINAIFSQYYQKNRLKP